MMQLQFSQRQGCCLGVLVLGRITAPACLRLVSAWKSRRSGQRSREGPRHYEDICRRRCMAEAVDSITPSSAMRQLKEPGATKRGFSSASRSEGAGGSRRWLHPDSDACMALTCTNAALA